MRLAIALVLLLAGGLPQDDLVKKIVSDAEKVKKVSRKISKESRDKIEKALGEKLLDADLAPPIWECMSTVPAVSSMAKTKCLVTWVTVKGPKGPVKVGVAAATLDTTVHLVKILENADDRALEAKSFLSQFEGFEYTPNIWNPPDVLAGAIKKSAGADDAAKDLAALLRVNSLMRAVGLQWDRMQQGIEKKDPRAADEIASMDQAFDETLKVVAASKVLSAAKQDKFKAAAAGARTDLAELKGLIGSMKFDQAFKKSGEIDSARCAKCHGAYRRAFRDGRLTQNIGNGCFSTKLEVAMPDPRLEASYQAIAAAIHKAILLETEAK